MKKFLSKNLYKILLGVLTAVFTLLCAFGMGNLSAPSTYYAFGEMENTSFNYNAAVYELELEDDAGKTYTLDSVWINIGSNFTSDVDATEGTINVALAPSRTMKFGSVGELTIDNTYDKMKIGGWQELCSGTQVETRKSYPIFMISTNNNLNVKINELAFVGKDASGDKVLLKAYAIGSGAMKDKLPILSESDMFDMEKDAVLRARKLIDEQHKFDLTRIDNFNVYKNDESTLFTPNEVEMLESLRNVTTGRGYFVSATAHPLAYYVMSLGTAIFGYTTVGIRFMPMLFGIATVILMFALGKLLFGKEAFGLLLAFLFVIGGFALSLSTAGSVATMYIFLVMLAFYGVMKFYRKGVSNKHKVKGYLNLLMAGTAFGFAVAMKTQAIYFAPVIIFVLVLGFMRQRTAYKARQAKLDEGSEEYKTNQIIYKNKRFTCLGLSIIGFVLVPFILYVATYLASFSTYSTFYKTTGLFAYASKNFVNSFTATMTIKYLGNVAGGVGGWVLNFTDELLAKYKYVFGNMIMAFAGVFSMLYAGFYSITTALEGKRNGGMSSEKKLGVVMPYLFAVVGMLGGWLLNFIGGNAGISGYYGASIFMTIILVSLIKAFETENYKPLFKVAGVNVTVSRIIATAIILAATVAFALAVPAYLGIPTNNKLFMWNILQG